MQCFTNGVWFAMLCDQVRNFVRCCEDRFVDRYKAENRQSSPIVELILFTLNSASVVSLYFTFPCSFKKCPFSFAGARLELLNLALQIMHWGRWIPSRFFIHMNPYCTYSSIHFLILLDLVSMKGLKIKRKSQMTYNHNNHNSTTERTNFTAAQISKPRDMAWSASANGGQAERDVTNNRSGLAERTHTHKLLIC